MTSRFRPAGREQIPPGDIIHGSVAFRVRSGCFEISTGIGNETYDIPAHKLETDRAFTDWVWQIQEKRWMTGQKFADFFACLSDFIYCEHQCWPQDYYAVIDAGSVNIDRPSLKPLG